jgi:hypothetical protein
MAAKEIFMRERKLFATRRILSNTHPKSRSWGDLPLCAISNSKKRTAEISAPFSFDYRG